MRFDIPPDSLALRYDEAYRQYTWEGVRGPSGEKVIPEPRDQIGPTCIYEAICAWMDSIARLHGVSCKISSKDLQLKEENLMTESTDRTVRCIEVLTSIGLISEDDFESKNPNPTIYTLVGTDSFMPLQEEHLREATRRMHEAPLLVVFHIGSNYTDYVLKFQQRPVLSYERYEEGKMQGHAVLAIGYGVESVVSFWKFLNSHKRITALSKGLGRLLPQNVYYLIAHKGFKMHAPPPPPPSPARRNRKRKRFDDEEIDIDAQPMKKRKLTRKRKRFDRFDDDDEESDRPMKKRKLEHAIVLH